MKTGIKSGNRHKDLTQKKNFVRRMFDDISDKYDLMNRVISLGLDGPWRKKTVKPHYQDKLVLDICSGTGDMAKEILSLKNFDGFIVLGDFSAEMHRLARKKITGNNNISFIYCDAETLPFKDSVFDGIVNGFSLRNLGNLRKFGSEINRTLNAGGQASIIDMAHPPNKIIARLFYLYFYKFTPWFSRWFTVKKYAYRYLPVSLRTFLKQPEVLENLKAEGLEGEYKNIFGGIVAIYRLYKNHECKIDR